MTRKATGSDVTTYSYNADNRLTGVTHITDTWSNAYDALGNRVAETANGMTTRFVIDPIGAGNVVGEYQGAIQLARNVYGFSLIARQDATATSFYTFDSIGNASDLTSASGAVLVRYTFTPFGNMQSASSGIDNPFIFLGKLGIREDSSGQEYMRARSYQTAIGASRPGIHLDYAEETSISIDLWTTDHLCTPIHLGSSAM